jgi:hypothetical protein
MAEIFTAKSLTQTRAMYGERRFEMTFVDARGQTQTISLPAGVAAELAPILQSLAAELGKSGVPLTKLPKSTAVGSSRHERLVLLRFDDDPPYALNVDDAETLWRGVREEARQVALQRPPARQ